MKESILTRWTCFEYPVLVHFSIVRTSDFEPISIRGNPDQNRIFVAILSRENELLQTLFRTKRDPQVLLYLLYIFFLKWILTVTPFSANFLNLDISTINAMTPDELIAKVEHEKLYDETDMAQIEGTIRSGILNYAS